jgi:hypothetical protein
MESHSYLLKGRTWISQGHEVESLFNQQLNNESLFEVFLLWLRSIEREQRGEARIMSPLFSLVLCDIPNTLWALFLTFDF